MKVLIMILSLTSTMALADGENKPSMEERKARAIKNLDVRIEALTALKSCISSASKKGDLVACRKKHKEKMEPMRKEWQAQRKERKSARKARKKKE